MPPRIIPVGAEPPPLHLQNGDSRPAGGEGTPKRKAGDRFGILNRFVDFTLAGLSRGEIAVWLILFRDCRDGTARTSMDDLARRAGCDRATVFRAIRGLERRGLVKVVHRGGLGKGPSRYRVRPLGEEG